MDMPSNITKHGTWFEQGFLPDDPESDLWSYTKASGTNIEKHFKLSLINENRLNFINQGEDMPTILIIFVYLLTYESV